MLEELTTKRRRNYTVAERGAILAELKKVPDGQKGTWMREHGLYASLISKWQSRGAVPLKRTVKKKPSPKKATKKSYPNSSELEELSELRKFIANLTVRGKIKE